MEAKSCGGGDFGGFCFGPGVLFQAGVFEGVGMPLTDTATCKAIANSEAT